MIDYDSYCGNYHNEVVPKTKSQKHEGTPQYALHHHSFIHSFIQTHQINVLPNS
jgi:hypothetical protein